MRLNKKHLIILLIFIAALCVICAASAQPTAAAKTSKATIKINNFKPGVLWAPKALKLKNGDAIAGYVEYNGNMQFDKGTGVTCWYVGNGMNGDLEPHFTKLVKVKFYFKNKNGKVKTKTVSSKGSSHIRTNLIKDYTPYKADVWYKA